MTENGHSAVLSWRASEALGLLIESKGAVVTREQLFDRLWPGVTVDESSLNKCISQLRKALGDADGGAEYIETVPRVGYRLTVPVEVGEAPPRASQMTTWRRRGAITFCAAAAIAIAGWVGWHWPAERELTRRAEDKFRQGQEYLRNRDPKSAALAVLQYQEALSLKPDVGPWYASLAQAIHRAEAGNKWPSAAVEAAERAVALEPSCVGCQATLGFMLFYRGWQWNRAEQHLRKALERSPGDHEVLANLAMLLAATGRQREALESIDAALRVMPFRASRHEIRAGILYFQRRYADAAAAADRAMSLDPCYGWNWRAASLFQLGRHEEALKATTACKLSEHSAEAARAFRERGLEGALGILLARTGGWHERERFSWRRAQWLLLLGQVDSALDELEVAYAARVFNLVWLGVDPAFTPIHTHPRFQSILAGMGLRSPQG